MVLIQDGVNHQIKVAGNILRLRYFTETIGSVWDDDRTLAISGNDLYTSGLFQSIDSTKGSADQVLVEQGRIAYTDSKIYIGSQIDTTSGVKVFTIQISGGTNVFQEIIPGMMMPNYYGNNIYKKCYVRLSNNGSLY